jgi:hypothetical protein
MDLILSIRKVNAGALRLVERLLSPLLHVADGSPLELRYVMPTSTMAYAA